MHAGFLVAGQFNGSFFSDPSGGAIPGKLDFSKSGESGYIALLF